jgi:hypothetical protein
MSSDCCNRSGVSTALVAIGARVVRSVKLALQISFHVRQNRLTSQIEIPFLFPAVAVLLWSSSPYCQSKEMDNANDNTENCILEVDLLRLWRKTVLHGSS